MTATFWGSFAAARGLAIPAAILLSPEVIMWSSLATAFGRCSDPYVFESPGSGSGSIGQRYRSGYGSNSRSGSFYHQAKIVRKSLIPTVCDFLSLKN
jgi:hypothetical protein